MISSSSRGKKWKGVTNTEVESNEGLKRKNGKKKYRRVKIKRDEEKRGVGKKKRMAIEKNVKVPLISNK